MIYRASEKRKGTLRAVATALAVAIAFAVSAPQAARAQEDYPTRPITLVLPFGPGGIADITSRIVANALGDKLGAEIVIQNQPGAGGSLAASSVLGAPADGYTLALLSNGTAISVPLFESLPFDPVEDFVPVSSLAYFDFVFAVKAGSDYASLADILAASKADPNSLNVGTINVGSSQNLSAELFRSTSGIDFTIVPYKATPDLLVGLLGDEVDVIIDSQAALKSALDQEQAVAIASSGPERSAVLGNVPTAQEAGVAGFDVTSWNAIFAPAGTPPEIVETLNAALVEVLADPAIQEQFAELGVEARSSTPQEIGDRLKSDIEKWSAVIEDAGLPKM